MSELTPERLAELRRIAEAGPAGEWDMIELEHSTVLALLDEIERLRREREAALDILSRKDIGEGAKLEGVRLILKGGGGSESHTTRYLLHSSEYSTWACEADDCDALWYLEDGTPSENRMRYCPGCGRRIVAEVRDVEEQEAEDGEDDA